MTSEMPIKIGGRSMIAKIGGYTGKTESADPISDIKNGYLIWLSLTQSRLVPAIGKTTTITIGGKKFKGKVIGGPSKGRYGKYERKLKKILLEEKVGTKLSRSEIARLHSRATKIKGV